MKNRLSLLVLMLTFICLAASGQKNNNTPQSTTPTEISLQDSIQSLRADNADLRKQLDRMEKEVDKYRWDFGQTVNDYNDKMSNHIGVLTLILAVFALITSILAFYIPYTTNKRLEKEIDEVKKQAKNVEGIKEDVEKNANEANAPNFYKIGLSKYEEGKPGEALENIERAISLKKDYPVAIFLHGLLKYETMGVDEALTDINDAIDKCPYYADAIYIKSLLEFEKGNADEAVGNIQYAKKLKKDVIESYPYRSRFIGRMKALDNAIHYCEYSDDMKTLIGLIETEKSKGFEPKYLCDSLNSISIEIPNSVTVIGERSFIKCTNLTSMVIPNSVTVIGELAFWDCTSLTSIEIPDSVTEIKDRAFASCKGIKNYKVSTNNPNYCSIDGALYSKDNAIIIQVPYDRDWFEIPDSVTVIGNYAFEGCTKLSSIKIQDRVTEIGDGAFWGCSRLTSIEISDNVTKVGGLAFWDCKSLTSIKIPDKVTEIGEHAFWDCSGLTEIHLKHTSPVDFSIAFEGLDVSKITLYVPKGSVETYKKDPFYKQIKEIIGE